MYQIYQIMCYIEGFFKYIYKIFRKDVIDVIDNDTISYENISDKLTVLLITNIRDTNMYNNRDLQLYVKDIINYINREDELDNISNYLYIHSALIKKKNTVQVELKMEINPFSNSINIMKKTLSFDSLLKKCTKSHIKEHIIQCINDIAIKNEPTSIFDDGKFIIRESDIVSINIYQ